MVLQVLTLLSIILILYITNEDNGNIFVDTERKTIDVVNPKRKQKMLAHSGGQTPPAGRQSWSDIF